MQNMDDAQHGKIIISFGERNITFTSRRKNEPELNLAVQGW
jgi:hypothetical protein